MHKYILPLLTLTHTLTATTIPFLEKRGGNFDHIAPYFDIKTPSCQNTIPEFPDISEEAENFAIRALVTASLTYKTPDILTAAIRNILGKLTLNSLAHQILRIISADASSKKETQTEPPKTRKSGLPARLQKKLRKGEPSTECLEYESALMKMGLETPPPELSGAAAAEAEPHSLKVRVLTMLQELSQKEELVLAPQAPSKDIPDTLTIDFFDRATPGLESREAAVSILTRKWRKQADDLEAHLNENLIGQNKAIESFVWGIFNHFSRLIKQMFVGDMVYIEANSLANLIREHHMPTTILILGPSGTGKTEMFRLAMNFLGLPYGTGSGAMITKAGYIGDKPQNVIQQLFENAKDQEDAETNGAVFLDEIDKMAKRPGDDQGEFQASAQFSLLTLLEGTQPVKISITEGLGENTYHVETKNMLFVLAGAFADLIPNTHSDSPFVVTDTKLNRFGLRPELTNRIQTIVTTRPLERHHFMKILVFKNSPLLSIMREYFEKKQIRLQVDRSALELFARMCVRDGLGARNIKRQLQGIIDYLYTKAPKEKILTLTAEAFSAYCEEHEEKKEYNPMFL